MLKKILLLTFVLVLCAAPALAVSHEDDDSYHENMDPPLGLIIFIPHDLTLYMSEPNDESSSKEQMFTAFELAIDALDENNDGLLSKDELKIVHEAAHAMMGKSDCGDDGDDGDDGSPPRIPPYLVIPVEDINSDDYEAAFDAVDNDGDSKLSIAEIRDAMKVFMESHGGAMGGGCGDGNEGDYNGDDDGKRTDPEWPLNECNGNKGNEITHELTGAIGDNAMAISLPSGREAGCFSIESDAFIEGQIVEDTDPPEDPAPVMWHSEDGDAALADLLLEEGNYYVEIIKSDDENAAITVVFIDYPTE